MVTRRSFLSCDWGTTNLRLARVDPSSGRILGPLVGGPGVKDTYAGWRANGGDRLGHFTAVLSDALERLRLRDDGDADPDHLVVSGMASSSVGMKELEYAALPFPLTGETAVYERLPTRLHGGIVPLLLSGVRSERDVIRGEETQMIGLAAASPEPLADATYVLPGTHSKHIRLESGSIRDFRTFMTGELFQVVAENSILRDCVVAEPFSADRLEPFVAGVQESARAPLLHALFRVRSASLFGERSPPDNFWFLSGLLIGTELGSLLSSQEAVVLAAGPSHRTVYELALTSLGLGDRLAMVPEEIVERSAALGHAVILRRALAR